MFRYMLTSLSPSRSRSGRETIASAGRLQWRVDPRQPGTPLTEETSKLAETREHTSLSPGERAMVRGKGDVIKPASTATPAQKLRCAPRCRRRGIVLDA